MTSISYDAQDYGQEVAVLLKVYYLKTRELLLI
jgi:hypothetical protein